MVKKLTRVDLTAPTNQLRDLSADLKSKLDRISSQLTSLELEYRQFLSDVSSIDNELMRRSRPAPEPRVSDHALLRFIERVFKIDIDYIKNRRMLTPTVIEAMKNGATGVTVEGLRMKIADNTIVTVYIEDKPHTKTLKETDELKEGLDEYYEEH